MDALPPQWLTEKFRMFMATGWRSFPSPSKNDPAANPPLEAVVSRFQPYIS
jgi:hypothetical protein